MENTTLCYLEKDGKYLMLHRTKKENDLNEGKWIGVGGHFEKDESPEECARREIYEETGLHSGILRFRGVVTFLSDKWATEYMFLFTADGFAGELHPCDEGELQWMSRREVDRLPKWEGDRIFLALLWSNAPFFLLTLRYTGDVLTEAVLNGKILSPEEYLP